MGLLSALLFLGGVALIIGGIVAVIANRVGTTVGRDRVVRTVNAESNDLGSLTPTPSTPPSP